MGNLNHVVTFYKLSPARKDETLPLMLSGNASIFLHTTPDVAGRKQFNSEADVWLLRQQLNEHKQLPTESVIEFATSIRREECLNYFLQGLKTSICNPVILQRPATFEQAESHIKMSFSTGKLIFISNTENIK